MSIYSRDDCYLPIRLIDVTYEIIYLLHDNVQDVSIPACINQRHNV